MAAIEIFKNESFGEARVAGTSDKPLFCLADICRILEIKNVSDCKSRLDHKGIVLTDTPTNGGLQQLVYINEKNLYKVIMRSDKPQAEPFQDWVCGEVLPSIRKTGSYSVQQPQLPQTYLEALKALVISEEEKEQLALENKQQQQQISIMSSEIIEMKKKTDYLEIILSSKGTVTITQIAQDYGMSAKSFNRLLAEKDIQHKVNGQWILYTPYISKGYVHSKSVNITHHDGHCDTVLNTEWTQRGRLFLYEMLKKHKILPLIER